MPGRPRHPPSPLPPVSELARHPGEWVAIVNRKIVASSRDMRKALAAGRTAAKGREPSMFRVLEHGTLML
ncbi:MAG: hypothetical protein KGJ23_06005 [Euryarchaeota archaeon]|nr:hypothetical protein [Euryarchaeota archaeon]MDE1836152.1 hypothetical protein [Euryarchaeota archaeon]MDE1882187.1 hypothetical protein [Euryarchaeota archaeon]MDE2044130.1 hypothetical protein [Thermoplasmata archaeon]